MGVVRDIHLILVFVKVNVKDVRQAADSFAWKDDKGEDDENGQEALA